METSLLSILAIGFLLGFKHAVEPDHVIAVSTIASRSKRLSRSSLSGVFWGIGHTATLFIIGIVMLALKSEIPEKWAMSLEFLVGVMLVVLGFAAFRTFGKPQHVHEQAQGGSKPHLKSAAIGLVHGLAGSGAMVLLTMSTVNTVWEGAGYILVFGAGTVAGMLLFTTLIGLPFVWSAKKIRLNKTLVGVTAAVSIVFGFYYMYNLGVTEGLYKMWL